jgi:ABC-type uncharacterized transport system permease subunit
MDTQPIPALLALITLAPLTLVAFRPVSPGVDGRDRRFWLALALAVVGPATWAALLVSGSWLTGLATALWVTIAACLILFAGLTLITNSAWRLARLLLPYLLLLGLLATAAQALPEHPLGSAAHGFWIDLHIVVSVLTYALVTLAAVAALAGLLQERALKTKRPSGLTRALPPVAESERLQVRLLALAETVLGAGLLSGMTVLYYEHGVTLRFDHKTLFSIAGFVVIGALLLAHARTGVRGRAAARLALLAYLLLTTAYIGVKFVRDVLLSGAAPG